MLLSQLYQLHMLVHLLDQNYQHYTRLNQLGPALTSINQLGSAWKSCWFMLDFSLAGRSYVLDCPSHLRESHRGCPCPVKGSGHSHLQLSCNWLILAQSQDLLCVHIILVHRHVSWTLSHHAAHLMNKRAQSVLNCHASETASALASDSSTVKGMVQWHALHHTYLSPYVQPSERPCISTGREPFEQESSMLFLQETHPRQTGVSYARGTQARAPGQDLCCADAPNALPC